MEYRQLGKTDLKVSSIGLGCVTFGREIDESTSFAIMDHALSRGINLLDTAEAYGGGASETVVGRWIKDRGRRDDVIVGTKVAGSLAGATPLDASGTALAGAGFIGTRTDVDAFSFVTGAGSVSFTVTPFTPGPNLDVLASLFDSSGTLIASANPTTTLGATLTANLAAGQYYVTVDGTGFGNPGVSPPTGYSDYASLGRYSIAGTRVEVASQPTLAIGGFYRYRRGGEAHALEAKLIHQLQHAVARDSYQAYKRYAEMIYAQDPVSIRDLLDFNRMLPPVPVEPKKVVFNDLEGVLAEVKTAGWD